MQENTTIALTEPVGELTVAVNPESLYGILPDFAIRHYAEKHGMITPFLPDQVREVDGNKILSKGTSSFGYDITLGMEFKLFTNVNSTVVDPKKFDERCLSSVKLQDDDDGSCYVILPPNSYLLGHTKEHFKVPADIMVICLGKSTYARCGAIINVTPMEPAWEGQLVVEIANATPCPMKIYADEGIAQLLFLRGEHRSSIPYDQNARKYQGQSGLTLPRM